MLDIPPTPSSSSSSLPATQVFGWRRRSPHSPVEPVPCGAPYTPLLMCPSTAEEEEEPPLPTYLAHTLLQVRLIY